VKYLDFFLKMECDIHHYGITIPPRPSTQSVSDLAALRLTYSNKKIESYEAEVLEKMRESTKGRNPKLTIFNNYILDRRGPHDWRESKNPSRDYPRVAIISFVEPLLVKSYRPDLLEKSSAAQYLLVCVHELLGKFSKARQVIGKNNRLRTVRRYDFPDGSKPRSVELPPFEVDELLGELADARNVSEHLDLFRSTVKKLESLPFIQARPDLPFIRPTIRKQLDSLYQVTIIYPISSSSSLTKLNYILSPWRVTSIVSPPCGKTPATSLTSIHSTRSGTPPSTLLTFNERRLGPSTIR
jgi:hypothetical protein